VGLGGALSPLRERPFRLLWLGRVSSGVGDALIFPVALAFAVLSVHKSYTAVGSVLAAFTIARVSFTLVGGVVADRLPRRAVMLTCDLVRGIVQAFTAVMLLTGNMTLPLFFVTMVLFGAASAFFLPASDALVQQTVSRPGLQSANALLSTSRNTLNVFGPVVSGTLIAAFGAGYVFAIDAGSFAVSAFFLLQIHVDPYVRGERQHFYRELREGWSEVISRSWVRAPMIGFAISNICFASFLVLGPVIFSNHLGGARDWGIVSTCGAIGAILGSLASVRFRPHRPLTACFISSALIAVPIAALSGPLPMPAIAAAWLVGFGAIVFANTFWETTLQRNIPERVFARVRSYDILVSFVFMPIGMLAFGPIAQAIGFTPTLLGAAAIAVTTNLVVAMFPGVRGIVVDPAAAPA
jgi:MFS family permease